MPAIGVIRDKNLSLQAEKAALLTERLSADALDDKPACPSAANTGWVGANIMCACLKALCEEQIRSCPNCWIWGAVL